MTREIHWIAAGALALALTGCAMFRSDDADAMAQAVDAGLDAGTLTCTVIVGEAPEVVPQVRTAMARATVVLAADDVTGAALVEALGAIDDARWRAYAQAALRLLLRRVGAAGLDASIAKDSPVAAGAGAFIEACGVSIGGVS